MNRFKFASFALVAAAATLASCSSNKQSEPLTYEESAKVDWTGRVESLDQTTRMIKLRDPSGHSTWYYVSPQVSRLNEVRVGDDVNADYTVTLMAQLRAPTADEKANPILIEDTMNRASSDSAPSGGTRRKVRIVTTVDAVDLPRMLVTLKGPMGDTTVVRARSEENIRKLHVGDTIVMNYVESSTISLAKAPE